MSSRAKRPDIFFHAAVWRVGPRSRGIPLSFFLSGLFVVPVRRAVAHSPPRAILECGGLPPLLQPQPAPANRSSSPAHHRTPATSSLPSCVCLFLFCHPDRSGPTFSSAPQFGASGRAVEGSCRRFYSDSPRGLTINSSPATPRCVVTALEALVFAPNGHRKSRHFPWVAGQCAHEHPGVTSSPRGFPPGKPSLPVQFLTPRYNILILGHLVKTKPSLSRPRPASPPSLLVR